MNALKRKLSTILVSLGMLVFLDLWTKHLVTKQFVRGESKTIVENFFDLTLVYNTGAAFGLGAKWSMGVFVTTSVIAIALVVYLLVRLRPEEKMGMWALTLILSGAIGNLTDRIRLGYVVDFLDFYVGKSHWPAFNVADSCITVGAALYFLDILSTQRGTKTTSSE